MNLVSIIGVAGLLGSALAGWAGYEHGITTERTAAELRMANAIAKINEEAAAQLKSVNDEADRLRKAVTEIDLQRLKEKQQHEIETARLRGDVDAGNRRLSVRATCPGQPAASMSSPAGTAGVDEHRQAELDPGARPDYYNLRTGIIELESELKACKRIALAKTE